VARRGDVRAVRGRSGVGEPSWQEFFADYQSQAPSVAAAAATSHAVRPSPTRTVAQTDDDRTARRANGCAVSTGAPAPRRRRRPRLPTGAETRHLPTKPGRRARQTDPRRRCGDRRQHGAQPHGPDGDELPERAGQAPRGQPQGDQRLPRPTGQTKISFTHLIGYAIVRAIADEVPAMKNTYAEGADGKPRLVRNEHVNMGLAVDVEKAGGQRTLVVPVLRDADTLDFAGFLTAYEEIIRKVKTNKLTVDDFQGANISLTNPGTIGTVQSVPRLMPGQAVIVGVGSIDYPAEFEGTDRTNLSSLGRQQGRHDHEHLRPSHHPGRRVRAVPQAGPRAAARRARLLRGRLPGARHAVRGGQVASRHQPDRPRRGDAAQADGRSPS
jgi:multifunctional 2-oxoglutarate metabolism enzyme